MLTTQGTALLPKAWSDHCWQVHPGRKQRPVMWSAAETAAGQTGKTSESRSPAFTECTRTHMRRLWCTTGCQNHWWTQALILLFLGVDRRLFRSIFKSKTDQLTHPAVAQLSCKYAVAVKELLSASHYHNTRRRSMPPSGGCWRRT